MPAHHSTSDASAAQVRAQRDRILASKVFALSKRQSKFLDYVVDAALEGRSDKIKEFTLGIDVFGKDESFDPSVDSIVRVEASRLRSKLREYYVDEGQDDSVRIDIPKGHYVPVFRSADRLTKDHEPANRGYLLAGLVVAALFIAVLFVTYSASQRNSDTVAETPLLPPPSSLAVLPLRDRSPSPEEFFSDAMTDALISSLAEVPALRVTSLTSVRRYKNTDVPIPEIGRELGVAFLVDGSVYRDNDNLRISAQLIDADADTHVWSKTFERSMPELQAAQSEVASAIAQQISGELLPSSQSGMGDLNPAAYEAYMKGRYFYNKFTAEGYRRSIKYYQEAIEIEPDYAEAYAGLASCHCLLAGHGLELVSPVVALPESHSLAMKALDLKPDLAEPIAFLGIINFKFGWDLQGAETMLNRAMELNPSLYQAYVWHSQILEAKGRHEDAVDRARYAKQLNPLSLAAGLNLGWQMYQAGNYIEASAEIDKLIEFNPNFWGGHWVKGHIYRQHEMYEKAIDEFQQAIELDGGHSLPISALGHVFAVAGMRDRARQVIVELESLSKDIYVSPFHVATIYAGLNEPDQMFEWLERAYLTRARSLAWLQVSRELAPYHDDPRFQDLLKRIGIYSILDADHQAHNNPVKPIAVGLLTVRH